MKKREIKKRGFTLVELMIVIAIIAILAAVAISQYSAYKNKAKAKELVGFARACVMEVITQCQTVANGTTITVANLESCSVSNVDTKYLTGVSVSASNYQCGSGDFSVNATGTITGTGKTATVTCTYDSNNDDISCTAPTVS